MKEIAEMLIVILETAGLAMMLVVGALTAAILLCFAVVVVLSMWEVIVERWKKTKRDREIVRAYKDVLKKAGR